MTRKIEAVLHGLSEMRLDQTTEEQMTKMVPYLSEREWKGNGFSYRDYYVHVSNGSDRLFSPYRFNTPTYWHPGSSASQTCSVSGTSLSTLSS